jgi:hypothetical protein
MRHVTRFVHVLMLVLAAIIGSVPGGLARNLCLCPDAPDLLGHAGDGCGMACCELPHLPAPGAPASAQPAHGECGACHTIATGEREAPPALASTVDLTFVALTPAASVCVPRPRIVMHARLAPARVDRGPPGRSSNLPLRI